MSVVYVHVGLPKTGTTHLQDRLWRNRDHALTRAGLLYPGNRIDDHFHAAAHLQPERYLDWADPAHADIWPAMVAQMREWPQTSLVSHELFANAGPRHIRRLVDDLAFADEVHAVLTVRDLARQVPSVWQENVKNQRRATLAEFVEAIAAEAEGAGETEPFWEFQDYRRIVADWSAVVGADRVHLVTVPAPGTAGPGDGLWERFVRALGVDPADLPERVPSSNSSLSAAQTELLRRLNHRLQPADVEWHRYEGLVKGVLIGEYLFETREGRPAALTGPQLEWAADMSEQMVGAVVDGGHPVSGTLDDLRVTATAAEPEPDASGEDALEAALDAMAEWVKTAPVPDRRPALKTRAANVVRRARRRLMR
ncbi:MAG: sulfotransferase family protein [Gordonia sp. (in: high G+C Gram-positive bacteria)]|uniref:sulfotransferase family protein n=1 Tax=Gordonia sp. (in: high G+C Gram-positive bacteria) TaxID=84139 RepID=UPI003C78FFA9